MVAGRAQVRARCDRRFSQLVPKIRYARPNVTSPQDPDIGFSLCPIDPMRRELAREEVLRPLLALLDFREETPRHLPPIYCIGEWARSSSHFAGDDREECRDTAATAIRWAANVLEDVLSEGACSGNPRVPASWESYCEDRADKSALPLVSVPILTSSVLDLRPCERIASRTSEPEDAEDWIDTDIELLTISASLLEGVVLASEDAKTELVFSSSNPGSSSSMASLLIRLLDFIESGTTPEYWTEWSDDPARMEKAFSAVKASVVRAVVEAPNSDAVMHRLWEETQIRRSPDDPVKARSWLVKRLVDWLHTANATSGREDLLICAAHMLASLGRKGTLAEVALLHGRLN